MSVTWDHVKDVGDVVVHHPKYREIEEELLAHVELSRDDDILLLQGPTGAGKSTVIDGAYESLQASTATGRSDRFSAPPCYTMAPPATGNGFPWKQYSINTLEALGEIGVDRKSVDKGSESGGASTLAERYTSDRRKRPNAQEMLDIVAEALNDRSPPALIIDECQHIGSSPEGRVTASNLDVIKDLRAKVRVPIILVGTSETEQMTWYSAQIIRRDCDLHFCPYYPCADEIQTFADTAENILDDADIPVSFSIARNAEELHYYSVGCIGILSSWLQYAVHKAYRSGAKKLTLEHMRDRRKRDASVRKLARDIDRWDESCGRRPQFWPSGVPGRKESQGGTKKKNGGKKKTKPGTPTPKNYPVHPSE